MTIRRQLLTFGTRSVDYRIGAGALSELGRMALGAVALPKRALVLSDAATLAAHGTTVSRSLVDAGFGVRELALDGAGDGAGPASLAAAQRVFSALAEQGVAADDLVLGLGDEEVCSLAAFCARSWRGGTQCVLAPTTLSGMVSVATAMRPLAVDGDRAALSLTPEPALVACDLALVQGASLEDRAAGHVALLQAAIIDSRKRWDAFGDAIPALLRGEEIALVDTLTGAQFTRRSVLSAATPSARKALAYGTVTAGALRACLGDGAPSWRLLAEGMRFEARLAHDAAGLSVDDVFEQDDRLDDLGAPELPFAIEPETFIASLGRELARRSNRPLFSLPKNPGTVRLARVEDDVLERHARAYIASRAELAREAAEG